jgi:2-polyprenyl-3-methyl-5-hydroxy-6-metoxy-1,4-benzoquinol methylase
MKRAASIMENVSAYRIWQAPFADKKLAPVLRHNDLSKVRRVLDVGCGPGTNTRYFADSDYLGVDMNEKYVDYARERFGRKFVAADVTSTAIGDGGKFDFVLCNSFFHHVDTPGVQRILDHLATLVSDDGHVHVLDLVLPDRPSIAKLLARLDRGDWPRPLPEWKELFTRAFEPVLFEPYPLTGFGVTLWNMVYFKGRPRRHA